MINARGLAVTLGGAAVLRGVDLSVERGHILGLIGPPEAGKTILLKAVAGLIPIEAGAVEMDGEPVVTAAGVAPVRWQQRIGMSFQNDALFDALTVYENVAFPLRRRRLPEDEVDARVRQRLGDVGLAEAAPLAPADISGGMRKRVGIARATVIAPEIGFFDDPIAGLDPVTGARILDLIVGLTATLAMATVIVSNDLAVLFPVCDRVVMLHRGEVVYAGPPDAIVSSERPEVVPFATGSDAGPL